jgi:isoquinoline 1-oxidoreductase alpha subunit
MEVAFTINDRLVSVAAASDTPLLWIIRESLGLTGTKFGCGAGLCGACTVHIDGERAFSCQVLLGEGLGSGRPYD